MSLSERSTKTRGTSRVVLDVPRRPPKPARRTGSFLKWKILAERTCRGGERGSESSCLLSSFRSVKAERGEGFVGIACPAFLKEVLNRNLKYTSQVQKKVKHDQLYLLMACILNGWLYFLFKMFDSGERLIIRHRRARCLSGHPSRPRLAHDVIALPIWQSVP